MRGSCLRLDTISAVSLKVLKAERCACCRTMAQAAKQSGQQQQEASIRAAAEAYFERAEDAPEAPNNGINLPLSEKTGFLAKDVRMLLRDTSEKVSGHCLTLSTITEAACQAYMCASGLGSKAPALSLPPLSAAG